MFLCIRKQDETLYINMDNVNVVFCTNNTFTFALSNSKNDITISNTSEEEKERLEEMLRAMGRMRPV